MKKYSVIAVDCDDVIVETSHLIIGYYNKTYGTDLGLQDMYSNDPQRWGVVSDAEAIARVEAYLATDEYRNAPPFREAIEATRQLSKKYELHLVTGRSNLLETATKDLLRMYFPDVFRSIVFTNLYAIGKRTKAEVCQELGVDLLIEDHLGHALPVAECGVDVLLFGDYPWNQAKKLPSNVHRVKNWEEVLHIL